MKIIKNVKNNKQEITINNKKIEISSIFKCVKLSDITTVKDGTHNSPKYTNKENGVFFITSKNLKNGNIDFEDVKFISKEDHEKYYKRSDVSNGDILFGMIGTIGNPVIVKTENIFSIKNVALIKKNDLFSQSFLRFQLLGSCLIKEQFKSIMKGGVLSFIKLNDIRNLQVLSTSIYQQEKIAHILSTQEEQIERIKGLIKKLEKRNQYYAEKLLSGELRIRENAETGETEFYENKEWQEVVLNGKPELIPVDWKIDKLTNIMSFSKGFSIKSENLNYNGDGVQYLRTNEVWDGSTVNKDKVYFNGELKSIELKDKNEYVVCFDGFNETPGLGTVGMVTNNGEGICCGELKKIKPIPGISEYYVNVMILMNERFQKLICKYAEGTTVKHAGKHIKNIKEVLIPINEQTLLNTYFDNLLSEIDRLKNILPKEEKRFQWMLDNLLSGEYEVVED